MIYSLISYIFNEIILIKQINLDNCLDLISFNMNNNHKKRKVSFSICELKVNNDHIYEKNKIQFIDFKLKNDYSKLGTSLTYENNGSITVTQRIPKYLLNT